MSLIALSKCGELKLQDTKDLTIQSLAGNLDEGSKLIDKKTTNLKVKLFQNKILNELIKGILIAILTGEKVSCGRKNSNGHSSVLYYM